MRGLRVIATLLVALFSSCSPWQKDRTIQVAEHDPEMEAAISKARSEVVDFIARLEKPLPGDSLFTVKVAIHDGETVEHFWLDDVRHEKGVFYGTLANDPDVVRGHKYGEPVSVKASEISDWMYAHDGVVVGGYTMRLLRKRMSPADREAMDREIKLRVE